MCKAIDVLNIQSPEKDAQLQDRILTAKDEIRALKSTLVRQEEENRSLRVALRKQDGLLKRKDKEVSVLRVPV